MAVTGQIVVYNLIVSVVTWPTFAGQFVTVAAQLVIVYTVVVYMVDVRYFVVEESVAVEVEVELL